ncbi:TPA: transposase, partial [Pseudomonas aeruginosa]|nr:transposase [Pseudomonas aeruginosa]HEK2588222.1 transposase [Pseudomonas aeruginosa]HEK3693213.1 transposase [Pseudomonas aeruginosa]
TRKARRDADRRQHLKTSEPPAKPIPPDVDMADPQADNLPPAKPFDQIEEWSPSMNIRGLAMECSRT